MNSSSRLSVAAVVTLFVVAAVFLLRRPTPVTPSSERARVEFARPIAMSTKGKQFSIRLNGKDAIKESVTVESGRNMDVVAIFPPLDDPEGKLSQTLMIVPRLTSQGDDAFQWYDTRVDTFVGWSGNRFADPHQEHPPKKRIKLNLRASEYRLRFYLDVQSRDSESGFFEKHLLGEAPLRVTGSLNTGVEPLDDPHNKFPVDKE